MVKRWPSFKLYLIIATTTMTVMTSGKTITSIDKEHDRKFLNRTQHLEGNGRIFMIVNTRYLQIFDDGNVNGTDNDSSDYGIFERRSIAKGNILILGLATCFFLCMNSCGLLYSSKKPNDECVFNERVVSQAYNTYTSTKHSTRNYTFYLALDENGFSCRVRMNMASGIGKWNANTLVLPEDVNDKRIRDLEKANENRLCPLLPRIKRTKYRKCRSTGTRKKTKSKNYDRIRQKMRVSNS